MVKEAEMNDREILEAALLGLNSQLEQVNTSISSIRQRLGYRGPVRPVVSTDGAQSAPTKRKMSAAVRKRIGEATRKRWAAYRKEKGEPEQAEKPKRKM